MNTDMAGWLVADHPAVPDDIECYQWVGPVDLSHVGTTVTVQKDPATHPWLRAEDGSEVTTTLALDLVQISMQVVEKHGGEVFGVGWSPVHRVAVLWNIDWSDLYPH